jgi:hypothetical protein
LFPKFPHISCFSEHHLKQIEPEQINLEGYKLGATYCRKSILKCGVCIFVHKKYNYWNVDLSKYCKEQDIEACAIKLELTALNTYVVTVYRATCGNFNSYLNGLDSIIKSLYKVELKSHRQWKEKQLHAVLLSCNLTATLHFPTRVKTNLSQLYIIYSYIITDWQNIMSPLHVMGYQIMMLNC